MNIIDKFKHSAGAQWILFGVVPFCAIWVIGWLYFDIDGRDYDFVTIVVMVTSLLFATYPLWLGIINKLRRK